MDYLFQFQYYVLQFKVPDVHEAAADDAADEDDDFGEFEGFEVINVNYLYF